MLEAAGVWHDIAAARHGACAIETIHILDGARADGDAPPLVFAANEVGGEAFGWIVENRDLRACLLARARSLPSVRHLAPCAATGFAVADGMASVTTGDGTFRARLAVGADGRHSAVRDWMGIGAREWTYGQQAVIACVAHAEPHGHVAVEHFRPEGPFAILPMADDETGRHRSSIVWTVHDATDPQAWPEDVFNAGLAARFPRAVRRGGDGRPALRVSAEPVPCP